MLKRKSVVAMMAMVLIVPISELAIPLQPASATPAQATGGLFTSTQGRIVDTRDGTGGFTTPMPAGSWRKVQVAGRVGVPASNVSAVVVSFTVVNPQAVGVLWADKDTTSSNTPNTTTVYMNYTSGGVQSNTGIVPVADNGYIQLYSSKVTDLVVDVQGYYSAGAVARGGYVPLTPKRLVDTRNGTGLPQAKLVGGSSTPIQIAGVGNVPGDASAAVLNFTVTNKTDTASHIFSAYPADGVRSGSFSFTGSNESSMSQVALSTTADPTGQIQFDLSGSSTYSIDLIVDVVGYFAPGETSGTFTAAASRIWDSRTQGHTSVAGGATSTVPVAGVNGLPSVSAGLSSVVANIAAINAGSGNGYLAVFAAGTPRPTPYSSVSYTSNAVVSNMVTSAVGTNGSITIYNSGPATVDFTVNVEGWYQDPDFLDDPETDEPDKPIDPSDPGELLGAEPVPSSTFGGVVQNANGTPQAGLSIQITDSNAAPDVVSANQPYEAREVGIATSGSDGRWTFTLPSPLPTDLATDADANDGILNLDIDVTGYAAADGTVLDGSSQLSVFVGTAAQRASGASQTAAPIASAPQMNSVLALHVSRSVNATMAPETAEDDPLRVGKPTANGTPASGTQQFDSANSTRGDNPQAAGQASNPDIVSGVDYRAVNASPTPPENASVNPSFTPGAQAGADASMTNSSSAERAKTKFRWDCTYDGYKPRKWKEIDHTDAIRYTIVGELHAYWDSMPGFLVQRKFTAESSIAVSATGRDWSISGKVTRTWSAGSLQGLARSSSHLGKTVLMPFLYRKYQYRRYCDLQKNVYDGRGWVFVDTYPRYTYKTARIRYQDDIHHLSMTLGDDVSYQDGLAKFRQAKYDRKLDVEQIFQTDSGIGKKYTESVSVFAAFISFQAEWSDNNESTFSQRITTKKATARRHRIFQSYCSFYNLRCAPRAFYSY